jgi:quercetin dioxygenase-like cupin family protein
MTTKLVALVLVCLMSGTAMAQDPKVTSLMSKDLAENPGREVLMITVEHAPGGSNAIHRHNAHALVYVLEGSVVMQLKGGQQVTLTPGQTFYEGPDDIHVVDRNASSTNPAKIPGVFDQGQGRSGARASRVTVAWTKRVKESPARPIVASSRFLGRPLDVRLWY